MVSGQLRSKIHEMIKLVKAKKGHFKSHLMNQSRCRCLFALKSYVATVQTLAVNWLYVRYGCVFFFPLFPLVSVHLWSWLIKPRDRCQFFAQVKTFFNSWGCDFASICATLSKFVSFHWLHMQSLNKQKNSFKLHQTKNQWQMVAASVNVITPIPTSVYMHEV